ncbi:DUF2835 domain-containing protein [Idiomarina ramblicola]|uniref:DUF2835 domain-containing protein n=1 Tax=Idiomarina ramblicola TaxID=263724 RepID=A0A432Z500_9GAMM|nr:DUF2835 domain-containing protein [Idiomarina ramblicola]RUO72982.1 DUF2835 domain-containing protein [Idiomarina ramblicola]
MTIEYVFGLSMSYQEYCDVYYSKGYQQVVVTTDNGTRVALPAGRLIPFIDSQGIHGRFVLQVDHQQKFVGLKRLP